MSDRHCPNLFLALDLGTTTLAGRLVDAAGVVLAEAQRPNPQRALGADILARLQAAAEGTGGRLQALLLEGLRPLINELLAQAESPPAAVAAVAAAGNPGISYLLRNLPVEQILAPPH